MTDNLEGRRELDKLARSIHLGALEKGFYENDETIASILFIQNHEKKLQEAHALNGVARRLALITSEVSEALEEVRAVGLTDGREKFVEELADVVIRVLDTAESVAPGEIAEAIYNKHTFNQTRPVKHGKEF